MIGCVGVYVPLTHFRSFRVRSVNLATLFLGQLPWQFQSTFLRNVFTALKGTYFCIFINTSS